MKKILCFLSFALLITLTGCTDVKTTITNGDEALITVGKTEITKDEIYTALKIFSAFFVINKTDSNLINSAPIKVTANRIAMGKLVSTASFKFSRREYDE